MTAIDLELNRIDVEQEEQERLFATLAPYRERLRGLRAAPADEPELSITLPDASEAVGLTASYAEQYSDVERLFLVGIGGSNLGALAVYQALFGTQPNLLRTPKLIPIDTVEGVLLEQAVELLRTALKAKQRVLIVIASKSGTTTETVANADILVAALEVAGGSAAESVVVISDPGSPLSVLAEQRNIPLVPSIAGVGGRYSVLSSVGLFPLAVLGVPIDDLLAGGRAALDTGVSDDYVVNTAAQHAVALYAAFRAGKPVHDLFCFSPSLELYGKWLRQLIGESVGKSATAGIVPTVSIGSTDLHSVGQLYLSGPDTTFTTFVRVGAHGDTMVPADGVFASLVPDLAGRPLGAVSDAILDGTRQAYTDAGRTFCTVTLSALDAASVGQLMQQDMLTIMYLARLLDVNAFDQPGVERYKKETRRILAESSR